MIIHYPAVFKIQEPSGYQVRFVDIDKAIAEGETVEECLFNAAEVLTLILENRLERGEPIPLPSTGVDGVRYISPHPAVLSALVEYFQQRHGLAAVAASRHDFDVIADALGDISELRH